MIAAFFVFLIPKCLVAIHFGKMNIDTFILSITVGSG